MQLFSVNVDPYDGIHDPGPWALYFNQKSPRIQACLQRMLKSRVNAEKRELLIHGVDRPPSSPRAGETVTLTVVKCFVLLRRDVSLKCWICFLGIIFWGHLSSSISLVLTQLLICSVILGWS